MKKLIVILLVFSFVCVGVNVFAQTTRTNDVISSTTFNLATTTLQKDLIDEVCLENALTTRESSVITAYDAKVVAIKSALETRKTAMISAMRLSTWKEVKTAIKQANNIFAKAKSQANKNYNAVVKTAQTKFKTDKKACRNGYGFLDNNDFNL